MIFIIPVLLLVGSVNSQDPVPVPDYRYRPYYDETPKPYSFSYNAVLEDGVGQITRTETSDGTGRVTGSYSLVDEEGHTRVVDYVADENGFRAHVRTNEPGTANQNPADVIMESTNPFANGNFQFNPPNPINRRPNAPLNPAAPLPLGLQPGPLQPAAPEVLPPNPAAPENVVPPVGTPVVPPVNRPVYRRPPGYRPQNYRPRNPYGPY